MVISLICACTSSSSSLREAGESAVELSAWASRSRLVRSEVSGVRSSWPASATSWRWRACEAESAVSIALKATASRATSSVPSTGMGSSRSVRAMSSTAVVSRRTGRSPLRATAQPASPAEIIPARPKSSITRPRRSSIWSVGSSDWARISASPLCACTETTRYRSPSMRTVRADQSSLPSATRNSGVEMVAAALLLPPRMVCS